MTQWHHWAPISTRNSSRFYRRIVVSNYKHSTCTMKELKSEWKRKKKFPIWVIKLANCWKKRFVPASPLINSEFSIHWKVVNIQNGGVKNNDEVFKSVNTWWSGLGLLVLYYLLIDSGTIAWKKKYFLIAFASSSSLWCVREFLIVILILSDFSWDETVRRVPR